MSAPHTPTPQTKEGSNEFLIDLDPSPVGGQAEAVEHDAGSTRITDAASASNPTNTGNESMSPSLPPRNPVDGTSLFRKDGPDATMTSEGPNEDERARTRCIEEEASEHLARRAAGLGMDEVDRDVSPEKGDLPATPPRPDPPAKDDVKGKAPVAAKEEDFDEKHPPEPEPNPDFVDDRPPTNEPTGAEIQNIMEQFEDVTGAPGEEEIMSPRLEKQQPILQLPPRTSSLEADKERYGLSPQTTGQSVKSIGASGKPASIAGVSLHQTQSTDSASVTSPGGSIFQPPPPEPEPEPTLPFDFHRFLEQLRHRTADPVARFLRSFLTEFGKKQWAVHEQVKIIGDFLEFIAKKMSQCEVWRTVSEAEFDNAREGMEKLVMNRLYTQTFSPAIPPPVGSPRKSGRGGRSAADAASPHGPGRRGQHQEDVERDDVIAQKLRIYGWINEEHLDIKPLGDKGRKFLVLAQQELLKINTYRAPRDKVICVLNCCKVIFGFLKNAKSDQSADAFVPLLIYTVLRAKPEHIVSNVQYIWRFRHQDKLGGEAGYYMSSLMGVVTFIENLDRTNITISDQEFEQRVEEAVSAIAEKDRQEDYETRTQGLRSSTPQPREGPMQHLSEKSALSRAEVTPRNSVEVERSSPLRVPRQGEKGNGAESGDDSDAVAGLLRTIQKPLSSIGRMFGDDSGSGNRATSPARTPHTGGTPQRLSPAPPLDTRPGNQRQLSAEEQRARQRLSAEDAAARQASAEIAQAQQLRARDLRNVSEVLQGMFPNLDREVIEDVVRGQDGNVGKSVDACLAMSG